MADTRTLHRAEGHPTTQALASGDTRIGMPPGVDSDAIYCRTAKGEKAIEFSTQRLSRSARRVLNLFDGARPLRELPRIVGSDELPQILQDLLDQAMIELVGSSGQVAGDDPHPDVTLARIKRALAGAFERELGSQAAVLEARVQDCVNLVVLRNVLQELTALVAARKHPKAAERIKAIVRANDPH
ncbi:MAG: hypothetical protein ABWZ78_07375 [Burkholderiaceae bacterium]